MIPYLCASRLLKDKSIVVRVINCIICCLLVNVDMVAVLNWEAMRTYASKGTVDTGDVLKGARKVRFAHSRRASGDSTTLEHSQAKTMAAIAEQVHELQLAMASLAFLETFC